jgi:hypothetical protein
MNEHLLIRIAAVRRTNDTGRAQHRRFWSVL